MKVGGIGSAGKKEEYNARKGKLFVFDSFTIGLLLDVSKHNCLSGMIGVLSSSSSLTSRSCDSVGPTTMRCCCVCLVIDL